MEGFHCHRRAFEWLSRCAGAEGVFRPFLTRVIPLKDPQGRVPQWFGTNTDVSEQKRAEEELRAGNENLATFNRVAVDRELRMIELKKEINALRTATGQPPRYPLECERDVRITRSCS